MKFKTCLILLSFIALLSSSCKRICVSGSGNMVTQERVLTHFTDLDVSGAYTLELTQDSMQKVEIVADDNLQEHILTSVNGNTLKIHNKKNFCVSHALVVKIHVKDLSKIDISGAVNVKMLNQFKLNHLIFKTSGATESEMNLNANVVDTQISGAGKVTYRGQAAEQSIEISGAGKIRSFELVTNKCLINVSGASDAEVNVLSELNVSASGASKVRYKGTPEKVVDNASGASSVERVE
ncbi:hypothetical protein C3K47_12100 [Solitalea longa]|uniref:Putative auto-transporter adhesin head GIN domain-containing protein n=1 Tax=Solitalea longa TaxID=2079460 RepID=A0A2S5A057_9SPHI|nr:head GIN domain-containing protein [Solitalea longa]POY35946.1 hypothetical protein C3K47_12100 [Solitalea longa]